MIEIIREENWDDTKEKKLPKDIRQIGRPDVGERIYIEDEVYRYLHPYESCCENLYMFCLEDSKITVEDSAHLWRQQYSWNIWNLMQRFQDGATMNGRIYING